MQASEAEEADIYDDPGNVNLDVTFYLLCLREFMTPISLRDILKLSWNDYGEKGEKSSQGQMNFPSIVIQLSEIVACHNLPAGSSLQWWDPGGACAPPAYGAFYELPRSPLGLLLSTLTRVLRDRRFL